MADLTVKNDCSKCSKQYDLTAETAVLHWYKKRIYCCNVEMTCPGCEHVEFLFVDESWREAALETDWECKVHEDAEDWLIEAWQEAYHELLEPDAELIPRHEGLVWDLGIVLAATPDEWLMEIFSTPAQKPTMPWRWR